MGLQSYREKIRFSTQEQRPENQEQWRQKNKKIEKEFQSFEGKNTFSNPEVYMQPNSLDR